MGEFIINKVPTGFNFYLKASNGETIGTSEVYMTETDCRNGISSVRSNSSNAELEDLTNEENKKFPKFQIYKDTANKYRFRLWSSNGQKILASEGYESKSACKNGIDSVITNSSTYTITISF